MLKKLTQSFSLWQLCVMVLFTIILIVRAYHLNADPPIDLSPSGGLFGDGVAFAHNARNKILFGEWITDDFNPFVYNPFYTILQYLSFSVFGVGLIQLRLINVSLIFLSFILLFLALKERVGKRVAFFAVLLLGFNYIFLMYNRLGLNDTFLIFPLILTLYLWHKGLDKQWILFFAGMTSFACYATKASALYFVLVTFISLIFAGFQKYKEDKNIKNIIMPMAYFISGFAISFIIWYALFFLPNETRIASVKDSWLHLAMPSHLGRIWKNLSSFTFLRYLSRTPVEIVISWAYGPILLYRLLKDWKKVQALEIFIFLWLVGGYIVLNGLNYRPLRYFVSLLPPICILASFALNKMWEIPFQNFVKQKYFLIDKVTFLFISFFWMFYPFWIFLIINYCIGYYRLLKGISSILMITIVLSLFYFIIQRFKLISHVQNDMSKLQILSRCAVIGMLVLAISLNGFQYLEWAKFPKYSVIHTSKELGRMLDHAYIAGLWSPLATIENKHRALYVGNGWFNYKDTFKKYPITHLFLWDGNNKEELRFLKRAYPKVMKRATLLKTYKMKGLPVRLYEIEKTEE